MLKAVCFDMDGVLYDSMAYHAEAWAKASEDFGLGMTREDVFMHEGRTGFSTIDIFTRLLRDGLVTGSAQHSLLTRLNRDYPGIFRSDLMVTGFDVTYGKPDPEPYLMAMHKADVRPEDTMVVENAPLGVHSAVAAGAYTVACNTGPLPDEVLLREGANVILPSLQALADRWPHLRDKLC